MPTITAQAQARPAEREVRNKPRPKPRPSPRMTLAQLADDIEEPLARVQQAVRRIGLGSPTVDADESLAIVDALAEMKGLLDAVIRRNPTARAGELAAEAWKAGVHATSDEVAARRKELGLLGGSTREETEARLTDQGRAIAELCRASEEAAEAPRRAAQSKAAELRADAAARRPGGAVERAADVAAIRGRLGEGRHWAVAPRGPDAALAARLVIRGLVSLGGVVGGLEVYRPTKALKLAMRRPTPARAAKGGE